MVFDGLLYKGRWSVWKIRVSPEGVRDKEPTPLFNVWIPDGKQNKLHRWVFYNPKIAIVIQNKFQKEIKFYVPYTVFYNLKDTLRVMYSRLLQEGLYTTQDGILYVDQKNAMKKRIKISVFSDSLMFTPVAIQINEDENLWERGVKITSSTNEGILQLDINEVKTLFEVLDRLDINTYSLILSMAEQLSEMDEKLDEVLNIQRKILKLLAKSANQTSNPNDFTVDFTTGGENPWS